jgi:TIR domain
MKVFISWSGEKSRKVAAALHAWLPYIIQAVKPIMSSRDISKGDRWSDVLARELEDTQFGIVCLTPSNIKASWLNFEESHFWIQTEDGAARAFLDRFNSMCTNGGILETRN